MQAFHNIPLAVDLSRVHLIKQSHHDKSVEDHSEVDGRAGALLVYSILYVKPLSS